MAVLHKALLLLHGSLPKKILYLFGLVLLLSILSFCVFYRFSDYEHLKQWYFSLNGSFYKSDSWGRDFFTPEVKAKGNKFTLLGAGIASVLIAYILFSWRRYAKKKIVVNPDSISTEGWPWYLAVIVLALTAGTWSWSCVYPAYDEILSAIDCAEMHPFQTISYYMLPNNHMYFNLINNIFLRWWGELVQSGRFISLMAYVGILLCAFHWLRRLISNYFYAFLALLPVAFQFTVWCMSAQARGYEMQLLCAWVSFITMFRYAQTEDNRMLKINMLFNILGFVMVSTYLLYYAAQTAILLSVMAYNRRFLWRYYLYHAMIVSVVFLLYIPAFSFSGVNAFTDNAYVRPAFGDWYGYLPTFADLFRILMNFCFSTICGEDRAINFILFFLPLVLFFSRRRERRLVALCYTMLWLLFIIITLHLRRNPFNRNMIMHYSFTMAFCMFTLYTLVEKGASLLKATQLRQGFLGVFFILPVVVYVGYLGVTDKRDASLNLYYNNVNQIWINHTGDVPIISPTATIWCGDESYYMYYMFRHHHYKVFRFAPMNADYIIIRKGEETFPAGKEGEYEKVAGVSENYEFYKHR